MAKVASTNTNILNAVRSNLSAQYQALVPEAGPATLNEVYQSILNSEQARNELVPALVDLIGMQSISTAIFRNPIRGLKAGEIPFSATEQEIFVNFAEGITHNPKASCEDAFGIYESYIMAAYHRVNFNKDYPVTIWYEDLRTAFLSDFGLKSMINAKVESIISGANLDEYLNSVKLIDNAYAAGACYPVTVTKVTNTDSGNDLTKMIQSFILHMSFPHPEYNFAGSTAISSPENLVLITTPEVQSTLNVDTLAGAYHLSKMALNAQIIVVDHFENTDIQAALVDRRFFRIRDQYRLTTTDRLNMPLRWNTVYHVKEMFSYSPFYPVIIFTSASVGITAVAATASSTPGGSSETTYKQGSELYINVTTTPATAGTPSAMDYAVTGNSDNNTYMIAGTNILHVGSAETGSLNVTITSRYKSTVTTSVTLTKAE